MKFPFYSVTRILEEIKKRKGNIRKSLGQNFLIDPNYVEKIYQIIIKEIPKGSLLLEIGPGLGALTHKLLFDYQMHLVEIDPLLCDILKSEIIKNESVILNNQDILIYLKENPSKYEFLIGNLPYYITTDIFTNCVQYAKKPAKLIFLVQKEYADKLIMKNNSISIYLHNYGRIERFFSIPKESFYPKPEVHSSLILFELWEKTYSDPEVLQKVLRMSFRGKRKKLINSWKMAEEFISISLLKEGAKELSIDIEKRAEDIDFRLFYELVNYVVKNS
ncbi:MAG: 16S rRNA (adenine(1518)-N(6)/adenine(1519)-N(6))-dimethyltransferase RsmA [Leptospiraceae bacterium]|nr:16S rRNA (adenine(1518)-N(6)/adenine(1519)-N(6))-dimethyltransferase RsmA [Leptospiraceae bacterium]MDW7975769.1 16S rRNA (adenine(1518)-N(6)/adenine(1519)-N(6))-dimethyltransferase RsmA [Leptospiraceae bacterium]